MALRTEVDGIHFNRQPFHNVCGEFAVSTDKYIYGYDPMNPFSIGGTEIHKSVDGGLTYSQVFNAPQFAAYDNAENIPLLYNNLIYIIGGSYTTVASMRDMQITRYDPATNTILGTTDVGIDYRNQGTSIWQIAQQLSTGNKVWICYVNTKENIFGNVYGRCAIVRLDLDTLSIDIGPINLYGHSSGIETEILVQGLKLENDNTLHIFLWDGTNIFHQKYDGSLSTEVITTNDCMISNTADPIMTNPIIFGSNIGYAFKANPPSL